MNAEKEKLLKLLNDGKISEHDFRNLSDALEKKSSSFFSLLINPFHRIAGMMALGSGIFVLLLMSGIGSLANTDYAGILDLHFSGKRGFVMLLYQNGVSWIVLSSIFFSAALLNKQKGLRVVDFLGTTALSRFPYLIFTLLLWVLIAFNPSMTKFQPGQTIPTGIIVMGIPALVAFVWQLATYFYALKESSGLNGKRLWISFVAAIFIGEAITVPLTRIFF